MKTILYSVLLTLIITPAIFAMGKNDDPWLSKVMGEIELLEEDDAELAEWEIDIWFGRDLSKLWLKTEGEYSQHDGSSELEQAQIEWLYSHAVSAYWDRQYGLRYDVEPEADDNKRYWLALGYRGLAAGFWAFDTNLYFSNDNDIQLTIEIEKELMLSQQWVLTPEFDISVNARSNRDYGEGSGLSVIEASLRLGYEPNKKFQPFIGASVLQTFGTTKSILASKGEDGNNFSLLVGIHFWF